MQFQHTAGPWYTGVFDGDIPLDRTGKCPRSWGIGNGRAAIARALITGCVSLDEAKANALLIAASPDLLSVVREVVLQMSSSQARANPAILDSLEQMARAALAKAEPKEVR